jgi:hypothetical protein
MRSRLAARAASSSLVRCEPRLRRIKELAKAIDPGQSLLRFLETVASNRRHYDVIATM